MISCAININTESKLRREWTPMSVIFYRASTHTNMERKRAMCGYWKSWRVIPHSVYAVVGLWRLHALVGSVNGILNLIEEATPDLLHDGNNYTFCGDNDPPFSPKPCDTTLFPHQITTCFCRHIEAEMKRLMWQQKMLFVIWFSCGGNNVCSNTTQLIRTLSVAIARLILPLIFLRSLFPDSSDKQARKIFMAFRCGTIYDLNPDIYQMLISPPPNV